MSCFAAFSSCRASEEPAFTIFAGCSCTPPLPFVENSTMSPRLSPICSTTDAGNVTWFRSLSRAYSRAIALSNLWHYRTRIQNFVQSEIQRTSFVRQGVDRIPLRRLERWVERPCHRAHRRNQGRAEHPQVAPEQPLHRPLEHDDAPRDQADDNAGDNSHDRKQQRLAQHHIYDVHLRRAQ